MWLCKTDHELAGTLYQTIKFTVYLELMYKQHTHCSSTYSDDHTTMQM